MFPYQAQSSVPPDKFIHQLIIQALQALYIQDYETGLHFLKQIQSNLPRYMYQLNPAYRNLCKDIVKILQDGSLVPDHSSSTIEQVAEQTHPGLSEVSSEIKQQQERVAATYEEPQQPQIDMTAPTSDATASPDFQETVDTPITTVAAEFISELSSAVATVKDKKKKKITEDLTGSIDELEDFDF